MIHNQKIWLLLLITIYFFIGCDNFTTYTFDRTYRDLAFRNHSNQKPWSIQIQSEIVRAGKGAVRFELRPFDGWHDLICQVKWSGDDSGYFKLWHNGIQKIDHKGLRYIPGEIIGPQDVLLPALCVDPFFVLLVVGTSSPGIHLLPVLLKVSFLFCKPWMI